MDYNAQDKNNNDKGEGSTSTNILLEPSIDTLIEETTSNDTSSSSNNERNSISNNESGPISNNESNSISNNDNELISTDVQLQPLTNLSTQETTIDEESIEVPQNEGTKNNSEGNSNFIVHETNTIQIPLDISNITEGSNSNLKDDELRVTSNTKDKSEEITLSDVIEGQQETPSYDMMEVKNKSTLNIAQEFIREEVPNIIEMKTYEPLDVEKKIEDEVIQQSTQESIQKMKIDDVEEVEEIKQNIDNNTNQNANENIEETSTQPTIVSKPFGQDALISFELESNSSNPLELESISSSPHIQKFDSSNPLEREVVLPTPIATQLPLLKEEISENSKLNTLKDENFIEPNAFPLEDPIGLFGANSQLQEPISKGPFEGKNITKEIDEDYGEEENMIQEQESMKQSIINTDEDNDGKLLPLLYSSRPDDISINTQKDLNDQIISIEEKKTNDSIDINEGSWSSITSNNLNAVDVDIKNIEEDDSELWWPTIASDVKEDEFESWWPTNPVIIDSLEGKTPSEIGVIDWSFLDSEYPDLHDNKETQVEISSENGLLGKIPLIGIATLPRYSTSNINDIEINTLRSTRKSDIEVQRNSSRRGSLSMIEMIKEMTITKIEDPEDEPGFLERNPTWEDTLEPINIGETIKEEQEIEQGKLQKALEAVANADGGVFVGAHHSIAQKRWKNAYLTLKRLLALRKLERTSRVGPGAQLDGHSLGIFSPKHPIRKLIFKYLFCQYPNYYSTSLKLHQNDLFIHQEIKSYNTSKC